MLLTNYCRIHKKPVKMSEYTVDIIVHDII